jgi:hypothetical protein
MVPNITKLHKRIVTSAQNVVIYPFHISLNRFYGYYLN